MELYWDIYKYAEKGEASNAVLLTETILAIQDKVRETRTPVTAMVPYANMENYEEMENFLESCMDGKSSSIITYEIYQDGKPQIPYISCTKVKEWKYTDKGWFSYELCVPTGTRSMDFMMKIRIIRMPAVHMPHRIRPAAGGVPFVTDSVKSPIQLHVSLTPTNVINIL